MDDTPPAEELLKKLQVLEEGHAYLKQELSEYSYAELENQRALSKRRSRFSSKRRVGGGGGASWRPPSLNFSDRQYLNILQSIGQSVYIFDLSCRIIYW